MVALSLLIPSLTREQPHVGQISVSNIHLQSELAHLHGRFPSKYFLVTNADYHAVKEQIYVILCYAIILYRNNYI